ncbi:hypothetical protein Belba_0972 [Belliella baltica DSM 15883]|uniref:Uncharacterized protein n=1 Tax=Belliella baltica (strain DSM 15883 / CIP 108006 / LMG 21964 / BA134) TaxID=866536 RepID=I3Z2Z7_BELBD|nr:hypothetical protein Belba_0972 [Belliella baltica DSM 15883]
MNYEGVGEVKIEREFMLKRQIDLSKTIEHKNIIGLYLVIYLLKKSGEQSSPDSFNYSLVIWLILARTVPAVNK